MTKRKGLLITALVLLLSSLLCLGLYRYDNKYTQPDLQPISGVLFYDATDPLCYLTRQWLLYPDVLLTPEDVPHYTGYRCYGDIGGPLDRSADCVTYRLILLLPDTLREYALELPEIFSNCCLYVNGRPLLQLGDPYAPQRQGALASRVVTFSASGSTELLIAVSDSSGIRMGMTYPPAFGSPTAVMAARELRLLLHGSSVLLSLLGALLAFSFGLRGDRIRGTLNGLLCLTFCVVTGYPLYHGLIVTGIQPWYTLEPLCYYGMLFLALLLQCHIYQVNSRLRLLLAAPALSGLCLTLIRFGGAAILPNGIAQIFSWLSAGLKYYTALCLLWLSLWAFLHDKCRSSLLLWGSTALAACLVWDRILPLYEPIYGGWLGEIGGLWLVLSLTAAVWMDATEAQQFRLTYQASLQHLQQRLALQKEHYGQLSQQVRLAREASHDLRHHMRTLQSYAHKKQWSQLEQYLAEYEPHVRERELTIWSDHPAADAVLSYYAGVAKELHASYDVRLSISPQLPFPDDELCILLSNLLENAVEAMAAQPQGPRRLYLRGESANGRLGLVMDNTYHGTLRKQGDVFLSTKHSGVGLGLSSITTIAEKYGGLADFYEDQTLFHSSVLIPLPTANSETTSLPEP